MWSEARLCDNQSTLTWIQTHDVSALEMSVLITITPGPLVIIEVDEYVYQQCMKNDNI